MRKTEGGGKETREVKVPKGIYAAALAGSIIGITHTAHAMLEDQLVAAVLIAEAGGEGRKGMEAVNEVICNRVTAKHATRTKVVLLAKQFSCLNSTTPDELVQRAQQHPRWKEALAIAESPKPTNWTKGANHYHVTDMKPKPK